MASFTESAKGMEKLTVEGGAEDLTKVEGIDTKGISRCLEVRFKRDEIYTYCGTVLVACNPFKQMGIYKPSDVRQYSGTRMGSEAPHIYATAEAAFDRIRDRTRNQSVVISGESGAGKTVSTKHILHYLTMVATPARNANDNWITKQILEANTILEAFGNAKTLRNNNSSRFGKFTQVCFEDALSIGGCVIEDYLLEKGRITWQAVGERNYHVFYQLCAACRKNADDRVKFMVEPANSYKYLQASECYTCEGVDDYKEFENVRKAMTVLSMPEDFQNGVFSAVSVVLSLGNLEFEDMDGEHIDMTSADMKIIEKVAALLNVNASDIRKALEVRIIEVRGNVSEIPLKFKDAVAARDTLAQTIYSRTFSMLIDHINKQTNKGDISTFIGVLDIFGFENFEVNSFEQLCINWTNEKLHKIFNEYNFEQEQAEYREEGISVEHFEFKPNDRCLELIEKGKKCILGYLDESCKLKTSTDADFLDKVHRALPEPFPDYYVKPESKDKVREHFGVRHFAGVVLYNIESFVSKNRAANQDLLWKMLQSSPIPYVKEMGTPPPPRYAKAAADSAGVGKGDKRNFTPSQGAMFKEQLGELQRTLSLTDPWYVRCIKTNNKLKPAIWEGEMVLEQLQYTGMLEVIQIRSRGFPCKVKFKDFLDKFRCLAPADVWGADVEPAETVRAVMQLFEQLNPEDWQVGLTKVFLRQRCYDPLEDMRRKVITDAAVVIQSYWKMFRQRLKFLRTKQLALYLQMRYHIYIALIMERRERIARERLQAWILGYRARKMYRQMLRERDEKKRSKAERKREREKMLQMQADLEALQLELDKASERHAQAHSHTMAMRATVEDLKAKAASEDEMEEAAAELAAAEVEEAEAAKHLDDVSRKESELRHKLHILQGKKVQHNTFAARKKLQQSKGQFSAGIIGGNEEFFYVDDKGVMRKGTRAGEVIDGDPTLLTYANRNFRDDFAPTKQKNACSFREMLTHTKSMYIPQSLTQIESIELQKLACKCWHDMQKYLRGSQNMRSKSSQKAIEALCAHGRQNQELRDELYCQLVRQLKVEYSKATRPLLMRGWMLMKFFATSFPPSNFLYKHLNAFFHANEKASCDGALGEVPTILNRRKSDVTAAPVDVERTPEMILRGSPSWVRAAVKQTKINGVRKYPHSTVEFDAIQENRDFEIPVWFHDGTHIELSVNGSAIASEIIADTSAQLGLEDSSGWGIFSVYNDHQQAIRGMEYVGDIVAMWEQEVAAGNKGRRRKSQLVPPKPVFEAEAELNGDMEALKALLRRRDPAAPFASRKQSTIRGSSAAPGATPAAAGDRQAERAAHRRQKEEKLERDRALARIQKLQTETKNKALDELHRHNSQLLQMQRSSEALLSAEARMRFNKLVLGFERGRDPLEIHRETRQPIFMFQKRLFKRDQALLAGDKERRLLYHQSLHAVLTSMVQVPVRDALHLGALRAFIDLGHFSNLDVADLNDADELHYGALEKYLSDAMLSNTQSNLERDRKEWVVLLAKTHRDLPEDMDKDKAMEEYIRVASTSDMYGSTFFLARYVGFWAFPQVVDIAVNEFGIKFTSRTMREELKSYIWDRLENIKVATQRELAEHAGTEDVSSFMERITFNLKASSAAEDPFHKEQLVFTFESPMSRDIAGLIASYSPHKEHQTWGVPKELETKTLHKELTPEKKHLQYIELMRARNELFKAQTLNAAHFSNGPLAVANGYGRKSLAIAKDGRVRTHPGLGKDYFLDWRDEETDVLCTMEEQVPRQFWQYTMQPAAKVVPLLSPSRGRQQRLQRGGDGKPVLPAGGTLSTISAKDIEHARRLFRSLRVYCGLESSAMAVDWKDMERAEMMMVQACLARCIESPLLCDEFFMQLIKMTTEHPRPNSRESHRIWSLFAITSSIVAPHSDIIYNYLLMHLNRMASTNSSVSPAARYCRDKVQVSHSKRSRKFPPSEVEQICAGALQPIQTRVYFLDKQFQTYQHEPYTTMPELLAMVKTKIGLPDDMRAYTLFEVFGHSMERDMQANELVADVLYKWEKFANATKSSKKLELTLKRGPTFADLVRPANKVEFMLSMHQAIYDVVHGKYPLDKEEAIFLAALRAQHSMGDFSLKKKSSQSYRSVIEQFCPEFMHDSPEIPDSIAEQHELMRGMDQSECDKQFLDTVLKWPFYGSMLYDAEQTYTTKYPKQLWLAVNASGISMLPRGRKEPLLSCSYHEIVSFSSSLRCLMVVAGARDRGVNYVLQTSQASQIAALMTRYCHRLKESGTTLPLPINVGGNAREEGEQMIKSFDPTTRFNFTERTFGGRSMYQKETPEEVAARKTRDAERRKAMALRLEAEIKKAELEVAWRHLKEEELSERMEEEAAVNELRKQTELAEGGAAGEEGADEYIMVAGALQGAANSSSVSASAAGDGNASASDLWGDLATLGADTSGPPLITAADGSMDSEYVDLGVSRSPGDFDFPKDGGYVDISGLETPASPADRPSNISLADIEIDPDDEGLMWFTSGMDVHEDIDVDGPADGTARAGHRADGSLILDNGDNDGDLSLSTESRIDVSLVLEDDLPGRVRGSISDAVVD